ncbi:MAG TPA: porin [Rhodospirillaceae bacterium]|nr:porin [Rhodospirillaceae bacterium]
MKKVLLASTALVAFGAVSAQAAEPIKLGLAGYVVENIGYAENNKINSAAAPATGKKVQFLNLDDMQISIVGSTKLDNGISVSVNYDLAATSTNQSSGVGGSCDRTNMLTGAVYANVSTCGSVNSTKRSYATVSASVGTLIVGEREDATYIVHNSAPDVSALGPVGDGQWYWAVNDPANHRFYTADNSRRITGRSTNKITYVSPAWNGLAAAFTYVPSVDLATGSGPGAAPSSSDFANSLNKGQVNGTSYGGDGFGGGLAYNNTFGALSVKADATMIQANIANLTVWSGGLNLGYGGFVLGGSIFKRDVGSNESVNGATTVASASALGGAGVTPDALAKMAAYAGQTFTAGLSYTTGPLGFSGAYYHDQSASTSGLNRTGKADSTEVYQFGAAYTAGPGVIFRGGVTYVNYKGDQLSTATPWVNNNDGIAVMTGLKFTF